MGPVTALKTTTATLFLCEELDANVACHGGMQRSLDWYGRYLGVLSRP